MPALAQAPPRNQPEIGAATIGPAGTLPSQRNPLLTDNGPVRIGLLLGSTIYNPAQIDLLAERHSHGQIEVNPPVGPTRIASPVTGMSREAGVPPARRHHPDGFAPTASEKRAPPSWQQNPTGLLPRMSRK
jgi:hypothetical protein